MEGLSRCLGSPLPLELVGRRYVLHPLTLGMLGEVEQILLAERETVAERVEQAFRPLDRPHLRDLFLNRAITDLRKDRLARMVIGDDCHDWLVTGPGIAYSAWQCLRRPGGRRAFRDWQSADKVLSNWSTDDLHRFVRLRQRVSGLDLLASLDWPAEEKASAKDAGKPTTHPWKRIVRYLASEYGWSLAVIRRMTIYQVRLFTTSEEQLGGITRTSPADAMRLAGKQSHADRPMGRQAVRHMQQVFGG